jgi:hypothetical protein
VLLRKLLSIALAATPFFENGAAVRSTEKEGSLGKRPPRPFKPMPSTLTVQLTFIPQESQRYDTAGDWLWYGETLEIRLSREVGDDDPRHATLLFVHELVEALLCQSAGIDARAVDQFDMRFGGKAEPGDDPAAPYHHQHIAAEAVERALADQLGVDWNDYLGD